MCSYEYGICQNVTKRIILQNGELSFFLPKTQSWDKIYLVLIYGKIEATPETNC